LPCHHVSAAALSDLAANDRRGVLLQHRPHRRRARHGLLRPFFQGGRLSFGPVLRQFLVSSCRGSRLVAAGTARGAARLKGFPETLVYLCREHDPWTSFRPRGRACWSASAMPRIGMPGSSLWKFTPRWSTSSSAGVVCRMPTRRI